jgi:hypothetical protein
MLHFIVFSYNRASQLAVLLDSIIENVKGNYICTVIYNSSELIFEEGYIELKKNCIDERFSFIKEKEKIFTNFEILSSPRNLYHYLKFFFSGKKSTNFKSLNEEIVKQSLCDFIAFLTDDSMFYREFLIPLKILSSSDFDGFKSTFSTRLGMNTIDGNLVKLSKIKSDYYCWNYYSFDKNIPSHYNYPFSVDGNIYKKDVLLRTIRKIFFYNPNTFESYVVNYVRRSKLFEQGICNENSCLIGFELNQVNISANNHFNINIRDLNAWYLKKYVMKYIFDSKNVRSFRPFLRGIQLHNADTNDLIFIEIMK